MAEADVDTRNLEWKDNNTGRALLQKLGWKDGQAIGKRRLLKSESDVSSEGLRVRRRVQGLGLGASSQAAAKSSISHAADFADVLKTLQEEHVDSENGRKRKKKKSKTVVVSMPTNKSTHAKVRQAKFQEKTADDMKCIFAGADVFAAMSSETNATKKKSKRDDSEKADKKKNKKDKKEGMEKKEKK
uniref:G-patch domain-containing protein n=1 Tax=Amphora coffeiformis TaxID=265554 RepID=A0A7S3L8K2_9STRA|mmetsp:Transcript_16379/g.31141  ORF Transcript_16379/g.31141 Transcript_16379/m.31141 type:complete len:187 (-) Transcript_16379:15-575(-)|eukprot:scaffold7349_cov173-Amphora_coffeaeformis.AAC.108